MRWCPNLEDDGRIEVAEAVDETLGGGGDEQGVEAQPNLHHSVSRELQVLQSLQSRVLMEV